jgi:hypothetical protein
MADMQNPTPEPRKPAEGTGAEPAPSRPTARPKRSGKQPVAPKPAPSNATAGSNAKAPADAAPDYAALGVPDEAVPKLEELRLAHVDLGRRSTQHLFEAGAVVHEVHSLAPDQKIFAKWAKGILGLSRTGAENLERVHRHLLPYRSRLVQAALPATAIYHLASAETQQVEQVIALRESGQQLTVQQVKTLLGRAEQKPEVSPDQGGSEGLKAAIALKTALGVKLVMDEAETLLTMTLLALEPLRHGKRIVISATQRPFIQPARLLRERLRWLTLLAVPAPRGYAEGTIHHAPVTDSERWPRLLKTLEDLGGYESWPKAPQVGGWLSGSVCDQLSWLLGERAKRAYAAIERMAAEAEAELLKARKADEQAKAKAKRASDAGKPKRAKASKAAASGTAKSGTAAATADAAEPVDAPKASEPSGSA